MRAFADVFPYPDAKEISEVVLKTYKDAGVDTGLKEENEADLMLLRGLPGWTLFVMLHQYCAMRITGGELDGYDIGEMSHADLALKNLEVSIRARWPKKLLNNFGPHFLFYCKNIIQDSSVIDDYLGCSIILAITEVFYDENIELSTSLTKAAYDIDDEDVSREMELRRKTTSMINHMTEDDFTEAWAIIRGIIRSPIRKKLSDYAFYLKKNFKVMFGDERVNEVIDNG